MWGTFQFNSPTYGIFDQERLDAHGQESAGVPAPFAVHCPPEILTSDGVARLARLGCIALELDALTGSQRLLTDYYHSANSVSNTLRVHRAAQDSGLATVLGVCYPSRMDDAHSFSETIRMIRLARPGAVRIVPDIGLGWPQPEPRQADAPPLETLVRAARSCGSQVWYAASAGSKKSAISYRLGGSLSQEWQISGFVDVQAPVASAVARWPRPIGADVSAVPKHAMR